MEEATTRNFVSILSETKPALVLFRYKADEVESKKIKEIIEKLEPEYPLLPSYEFIIDANEQNEILGENFQIRKTPIIMFFKNGCFNRYKDKIFNEKALTTFIGSKKFYGNLEEQKKEIKKIARKKKAAVKRTITKEA